ncbi:MAG: hypothetical protein ACLTBF_02705 [Christensenellales bacterium]
MKWITPKPSFRFAKDYHLLVPALPGYDFENDSDFSVEQIAPN